MTVNYLIFANSFFRGFAIFALSACGNEAMRKQREIAIERSGARVVST